MRQARKRIKVFPALCWRIIALTLALWMLLMSFITWAVAKDIPAQAELAVLSYLSGLANMNGTAPSS